MEIRELRVGNVIKWRLEEEFAVVEGIVKEGGEWLIYYLNISDGLRNYARAGFFEPVPLSESLLIDSGFSQRTSNPYWLSIELGQLILSINPRTGKVEVEDKYDNTITLTHDCNQLHHLQNIILDLSGKELPIKK